MKATNQKDERIEYLDVLRGIAIILMLMGHIGFGYGFDKYIHIFHMPIWFFLSGYFFKVNELDHFGKLVRKYEKSLLVPYVVWGVIQYPLWIFLSKSSEDNILEPLKNLFFINTNLLMPIAGALWFLTCLFFAQVIFAGLLRVIKNDLVVIIFVMVISLVGCYWNRFISFRLPWALDTSFVAVGFLAMGYFLHREAGRKLTRRVFNITLPICIVLFLINGVMGLLNGYVNMRIGIYGLVPLFWINAIMAILVYWNGSKYLYQFMKKRKCRALGWIEEIGRNSIVYLCLNQLIILVLSKALIALGFEKIHWMIRGGIILVITILVLYKFEKVCMNSPVKALFGK
ncbi:MAG: acyltransferase family protein [Lachnospiraceae bacterium]|nr:acyltransferase family protein [Lachnospiraceae bacterium]